MSTSTTKDTVAEAVKVSFGRDKLTVLLADGRSLSVPLDWFPRLKFSTARERSNWQIVGDGLGITWPDIDEDISTEGLIAGRRSMESQRSFARWMTIGPRRTENRHD